MSDTGWRLLVPGKLVVTGLLFLLPWIRISCVVSDEGKTTKMPMMSQSGMQIMTGDFKIEMMGGPEQMGGEEPNKEERRGPLSLKIYIAMVAVAALAGLGLSLGAFRTGVMALTILIAIGFLGLQTYAGFPAVQELREGRGMGGMGGPGMGGLGGGDAEMKFVVDYQPSLFGTWFLLVSSLIATVLEPGLRKQQDSNDDDSDGFGRRPPDPGPDVEFDD